MKERKRFLLYYDWENLIQDMNDQDIASLMKGIFKYQNTWEIPEMTYWAKLAFSFMRPVFDEDKKDWEEIRELRKKAWAKGWEAKANASKFKQSVANASKSQQNLPDNDIDNVIVIDNDIDNDNKNDIEIEKGKPEIVTQSNKYLESIDYLKSFNEQSIIPLYAINYRKDWIQFCLYWTESWKNWKIRAEWQKTFELQRRFATWMWNKKNNFEQKLKTSNTIGLSKKSFNTIW